MSSLPFGFWSVWDQLRRVKAAANAAKSSLPFGFWSVWDQSAATETCTGVRGSSLPFGFWSVWDRRNASAYAEVIMRLHCLSAFGLFGTKQMKGKHATRRRVFIAFRLLVCLGLVLARLQSAATETVFIAFRLLVCLGLQSAATETVTGVRGSSLPFGFWSVWDPCECCDSPLHGVRVFIAFRLLVCLGLVRILGPYVQSARLHCLSAFGLFGTGCQRREASVIIRVFIAFRLLVCLGQLAAERGNTSAYAVFIAFRLLVCLGLMRGFDSRAKTAQSSLPFGFWSVWDDAGFDGQRAGVDRVFIAFRLLVCLGQK